NGFRPRLVSAPPKRERRHRQVLRAAGRFAGEGTGGTLTARPTRQHIPAPPPAPTHDAAPILPRRTSPTAARAAHGLADPQRRKRRRACIRRAAPAALATGNAGNWSRNPWPSPAGAWR